MLAVTAVIIPYHPIKSTGEWVKEHCSPPLGGRGIEAAKTYKVIGTPTNGIIELLPWGPDSYGTPMRTDAPILSATGTPTITDFCQAAIDVNSYGADEPENEAHELQKYCDSAATAFKANDGSHCTAELQKLATSINFGWHGAYHLAKAFTWDRLYDTCNGTYQLDHMNSDLIGASVVHDN
ncbi:MAG TPA: hypothetical protein VLF59_04620 [Candidatus Saccharimonadales bacterium]|nr:hypothetical protein [Candidatus Saccharimonadales bacterium]